MSPKPSIVAATPSRFRLAFCAALAVETLLLVCAGVLLTIAKPQPAPVAIALTLESGMPTEPAPPVPEPEPKALPKTLSKTALLPSKPVTPAPPAAISPTTAQTPTTADVRTAPSQMAVATPSPAMPAAPQPTAPSAPAIDSSTAYNARLTAAAQAAYAVPSVATELGFKGRTRVEFSLRDGQVLAARLLQTSGLALADRAALKAVQSAAYPAPPPPLQGKEHTYQIWVACL
jgi:periplasmic protein TonB